MLTGVAQPMNSSRKVCKPPSDPLLLAPALPTDWAFPKNCESIIPNLPIVWLLSVFAINPSQVPRNFGSYTFSPKDWKTSFFRQKCSKSFLLSCSFNYDATPSYVSFHFHTIISFYQFLYSKTSSTTMFCMFGVFIPPYWTAVSILVCALFPRKFMAFVVLHRLLGHLSTLHVVKIIRGLQACARAETGVWKQIVFYRQLFPSHQSIKCMLPSFWDPVILLK